MHDYDLILNNEVCVDIHFKLFYFLLSKIGRLDGIRIEGWYLKVDRGWAYKKKGVEGEGCGAEYLFLVKDFVRWCFCRLLSGWVGLRCGIGKQGGLVWSKDS